MCKFFKDHKGKSAIAVFVIIYAGFMAWIQSTGQDWKYWNPILHGSLLTLLATGAGAWIGTLKTKEAAIEAADRSASHTANIMKAQMKYEFENQRKLQKEDRIAERESRSYYASCTLVSVVNEAYAYYSVIIDAYKDDKKHCLCLPEIRISFPENYKVLGSDSFHLHYLAENEKEFLYLIWTGLFLVAQDIKKAQNDIGKKEVSLKTAYDSLNVFNYSLSEMQEMTKFFHDIHVKIRNYSTGFSALKD